MFSILTILFGLLVSPAMAQNVTCATRPVGDNSNACASTAFVKSQVFACFNGASSPSSPVLYQCWANTTSSKVPLSIYDGSQWLRTSIIDTANHTYTVTGDAGYFGDAYSASQVGGWVNTIWPGSQYAVISPTFSSSVATGGGAGTFAARMSDTVGGGFGSIQTLRCLAYVDANPTVYPAWCGYVEGVLAAGTTGYYYGIENSIVSNWAAADIDPYSINTLNGTRGWRTSCGKGSGPTVTMCSAVMDVVQNPQVFRNGLVFASGWGDTTGGRIPAALVMPSGTGMQWYYGAGAPSWTLWATATGPGGFFALGNQAIDIYGAGAEAGTTYFHLSNTGSGELDAGASTGNYVALVGATAGTGSAVQAKGVDTDIDLRLIPKGSGKITANAAIALHSFISNGSAPTITGSGACTLGTQVGGSTSGKFTATAACATGQTYTISGMPAAINGYVCDAGDRTTSGVVFQQTSDSTTSAVLTVRTTGVSNADVIQFKCMGY